MESPQATRIRTMSTLRITLLQVAVIGILATFGFRLWQLQVVAGDEYRELAQRNRTRLVKTDASRGIVYDRTRHQLVRNIPRFNVLLIPAYLPEDEEKTEAILQHLHELLDLPLVSEYAPSPFPPYQGQARLGLRDLVREGGLYAAYRPILLKKDIPLEVVFQIEEEHLDLPGVLIEHDPYREYVTGDLTAHLLGYMGSIPSWAADDYGEEQGYEPNDSVGIIGIEASYEDTLRGSKGLKTVEVDVAGREVRTIGEQVSPQSGQNLVLTLDLDLQGYTEQVLRSSMEQAGSTSAVAIVSHVNTGQILAMVSLPSYDNNLFAKGIPSKDFVQLNTDPAHPLVNHATTGLYPPGSTFKLVPASGALQEQVVNRWTQITCPSASGTLLLPNKYYPDDLALAQTFYCWTHKSGYGHGRLTFVPALAYSCDIYFYIVSGGFLDQFEGLGHERLVNYAHAFGYGEQTGIDLSVEAKGLIPTAKWKRVNWSEGWTTGDTYNMAIGQGFVLVTPLQLLNATATIANGGTLYQPQLVYQIEDAEGNVTREFSPQVIRQVPVSEENLALVREGMHAVTEYGTAQWMQVGGGLQVGAKTGTAEYCDNPNCRDKDGNILTAHAWFTCFAPFDDPEIAIVVFVYGGGEGAMTSMPVASEILKYYFQTY